MTSPAHVLFAATMTVWVLLELQRSVRHRSEATKSGWGSEAVFRLIVGVGVAVSVATLRPIGAADIHQHVVTDWIGLGLLWCGISLRLWCFRTLGRYFTVVIQTSADQPVITSGPYRVIRHPSYSGLLASVTGAGLFTGNWLSAIGITVSVAGALVYRIWVEDRAMRATVAGYADYASTHKRLIPFVW